MKKILLLLIISSLLFSCNDYLDVNKDPNNPNNVDINQLLPSVQVFIGSVVGNDLFNMSGFFVQYTDQNPEANQYNVLAEYNFRTDVFDRSYANIYSGALMDIKKIQEKASLNNDWNNYYAATLLKAYILQVFVDVMDQAPYSEALNGVNNTMPKWDKGEDIYKGILSEIDEAEKKLSSGLNDISSDFLLDGNINKWIQFGNALKLKIYMRSSNVWDNSIAVKKLIDENNFFDGDIKLDIYKDEKSRRNPWYETNISVLSASNHVASYPIISYLKKTNDPRISSIFNKAKKSSTFEGEIPGSKSQLQKKLEDFSTIKAWATKPVYFYTQSELQFFISEAYLRYYNDDIRAKKAYEAAIQANFATRDVSNPSVIYGSGQSAEWNSSSAQSQKIELIGMQKWVAACMINNTEAWAEMRRLDIPKLSVYSANDINKNPLIYESGDIISPMVNSLGEGKLVKRLYYPQKSINLNKNTPKNDPPATITQNIWWDIN